MKFKLIFDGTALSNHEISPKDLSIALLSIDDLLKEANQVLNKGMAKIDVKVTASFETGCFKVTFALSIFDQIKNLLTSNGIETILNAKEILCLVFGGAGMGGVVKIIKFLKGGRPETILENEDGSLTIRKDGKELKSEIKAYELYKNYKLRRSFETLVSPVRDREGIEDIAVLMDDEEPSRIVKDEVAFFKCPEPEQEKIDGESRFETSIRLINLSFKEGNKWYVDDGQSGFYVVVEDEEFLHAVDNNNISFAKGDILRVKIRREQFHNKTENKLKTENYIEKVLSHQKPPKQLNLFE